MILVWGPITVPQQYNLGIYFAIAWPTGTVGTPVTVGPQPVGVCGNALAVNPGPPPCR